MKITPLEIRQKQFEKVFRGYDKDEVSAFLLSMSSEWEKMLDEQKELKSKLEQREKEVQKLREVESSLFKTLKTAEDTGANMIDQATKAAQLHMRETQMNAEAMMSEAKSKAKAIIEKAEVQAREIIEEMQDAARDLEQNYRSIESYQESLLSDLNNLSQDILAKVNKMGATGKRFSIDDHMKKLKKVVRESQAIIDNEPLTIKPVEAPKMPEFKPMVKQVEAEKPTNEAPMAQQKQTSAPRPSIADTARKSLANAKPKQEPPTKAPKEQSEISFFDQLDE